MAISISIVNKYKIADRIAIVALRSPIEIFILTVSKVFCAFQITRAFRWKNNFSNPVTKSADICKNAFLPEKSKLLEKNPMFWKIRKLFFIDLTFRNWTFIQTSFRLKNHHATPSSQPYFCKLNFYQLS